MDLTVFNTEYSVAGIMGVMDDRCYEQAKEEKHLGGSTPTDFHGYNTYPFGFGP